MSDIEQGSEEWFAARLGKATASKFQDLLAKTKTGASASRTNYISQLVVERLTGVAPDFFTSKSMEIGTEREPMARMAYEIETGNIVQEVGFILHESLSCGASPDGLIGDDGGIEIKCPQPAAHLEYLQSDKAPAKYIAQIQGGLWVTGRKWWDFVSFNPDFPPHLQLKIVRVMRDDDYIAKLEAEIKDALDEVEQILNNLKNLKAA